MLGFFRLEQWLLVIVPGVVAMGLFTIASFPYRPHVLAFAFGWLCAWCFMFLSWLCITVKAMCQTSEEQIRGLDK